VYWFSNFFQTSFLHSLERFCDSKILTWNHVWCDQKDSFSSNDVTRFNKHVENQVAMQNWSDTYRITAKHVFVPESEAELCDMVRFAHEHNIKIRPVGSALSPNGLAFCQDGMLSMALLDRVLEVDKERMLVRVQAGAKVSDVVKDLEPYGMTLQNYASIAEQQIGGFVAAGAHGTGASIPPVDNQVVEMKVMTPAMGLITVGSEQQQLLNAMQVGLGSLGIVVELTLRCAPAHELIEHTFVAQRKDIEANHEKWLKENRHLRYMWIPYTDAVVVVACNLVNPVLEKSMSEFVAKSKSKDSGEKKLSKARTFLKQIQPNLSDAFVNGLTFTQIRDRLLAHAPLDVNHIKRVNEIEADYWKQSEGYRRGFSDKILGFDCGGQQWVSEIAFNIKQQRGSYCLRQADIEYIKKLYDIIEHEKIPAASPIEQRWTSSSRSPMSPAYSTDPADIHSWVGIIMYLPTEEELGPGANVSAIRDRITAEFDRYRMLCERHLWKEYSAKEHWAKIALPENDEAIAAKRHHLAKSFGSDNIKQFVALRNLFDPRGILGNELVDTLVSNERQE